MKVNALEIDGTSWTDSLTVAGINKFISFVLLA